MNIIIGVFKDVFFSKIHLEFVDFLMKMFYVLLIVRNCHFTSKEIRFYSIFFAKESLKFDNFSKVNDSVKTIRNKVNRVL